MKTADQIRQCRTPQEALLVLAQAIDELREQAAPADPWQQPLEWEIIEHTPDDPPPGLKATGIAVVQSQLDAATDPDERRALEARLRLLKEDGGQPEPADEGRAVRDDAGFQPGNLRPTQAIRIDGGNTVELPVPTPEQKTERLIWAQDRKLWEFIPLAEADAVKAFAKGGPMWLYIGNRDAVMAMPEAWRRELVEMTAEDSTTDAHNMGRDILKVTSRSGPPSLGDFADA